MSPELEAKYAQRDVLIAQISTIVAKGLNATPAELALLKAYRRMLQSVNAQIVILLVPEPEPEEPEE